MRKQVITLRNLIIVNGLKLFIMIPMGSWGTER